MPYVFKWTRRDAQAQVNNVGGFVELTVTGGYPIDDQDYTQNGAGTTVTCFLGTRVIVGTVTAVYGQQLQILTDIPYLASFPATCDFNYSGWLTSYAIEMEVLYLNPKYYENESLVKLQGYFNTKGELELDIRSVLEHEMDKVNRSQFAQNNPQHIDLYKFLTFQVRWRQLYIEHGSATIGQWQDTAYTHYAVDGAKRLQEEYGGAYAEYETTITGIVQAKFLTRFDKPKMFIGYPFSLSVIFGLTLRGIDTFYNNKVKTDTGTQVQLFSSQLNSVIEPCILQLTVPTTNAWNLGARVQEVSLFCPDVGALGKQVTETKVLNLNNDCREEPIYLMWKNSLGGWDFWLFDKRYEINYSVKQEEILSADPLDPELALYKERVIGAEMTKGFVLGDVVTREEAEVIAEIEMSPQVYMLNDAKRLSGNTPQAAWLGVIVMPSGVKVLRQATTAEIEVKIKLPTRYSTYN